MKKYKYFENVENNAAFIDIPCQFCGSVGDCLDAVYFENGNLDSICIECFEKGKAHVIIPKYVAEQVKVNVHKKVWELSCTPPVPWIQYNEWPACCDDFMTFIGEWDRNKFNENSGDGNGKRYLQILMIKNGLDRISNIEGLWNDIGHNSAAYVFKCQQCGKISVVCQDF